MCRGFKSLPDHTDCQEMVKASTVITSRLKTAAGGPYIESLPLKILVR
jgi:hypothetical protein